MQIGVVYPQTELESDPAVIRDYAQSVEGLGYRHLLTYEHVLGANPMRPGGWSGPYTYQDPFMEPFALFSYLAGVTRTLGFATGVLILPQRQTALVAKQAATLDRLCGGRFRLGVGLGWNEVEYQALGEHFHNRGKRIEEQITVLRALWIQELVNFNGNWHHIPDAGILPLPVQRPIPIWIGGKADAALKRAARLADGWMPEARTIEAARPMLDTLFAGLEQAGRNLRDFGIEVRIHYANEPATRRMAVVEGWRGTATHLSINTMGCGFERVGQHLEALARFAAEVGLQQGEALPGGAG